MTDPSFEAPFVMRKFVQAFVICSGNKPDRRITRNNAESFFIKSLLIKFKIVIESKNHKGNNPEKFSKSMSDQIEKIHHLDIY